MNEPWHTYEYDGGNIGDNITNEPYILSKELYFFK